ncbi:RAI1-domain-containing protein [Basidiobolus meristosporus CBS 931.73]|uniref:Decapping nuclease n=1 Tax=Basidiobolus meristosporus CBS 931.73 TaxID=1314790 RepID=A0A1Y1XC90_9FUNG|nr:RAI1-domain-containing protein [Basidiobolus meristosporus CBS 931.73]|eukprot:ORX83401.1 RAI1-domain-containing protein [Basidiobolus meristosporus CBS 931.73]
MSTGSKRARSPRSPEPRREKRSPYKDTEFPLFPLERFSDKPVQFRQPVEIGSFSYDEERNTRMDDSQLKYYYPPEVNNNLSDNYDKYIERDQSIPEHIDALLECLTHIKETNKTPGLTEANFVCYRGIMTKIFCTPYARRDPWELGATLHRGTIYIEEHETEYKRKSRQEQNARLHRMCYWGYRFESLCTIPKAPSELQGNDDPVLEERKNDVVNTNIQYCSVVRTKIHNKSIIMGAEVDCITEKKSTQDPLRQYVELKTTKQFTRERDQHNFEKFKLIKFWAQSFLPGIPRIVVGFRDDDGYLRSVQTLKTLEIPRMVRGKGYWDATVCLNFANAFLDWLQRQITVDNPKATYTITFKEPFRAIEIVYEGEKNSFLTEAYLEKC